MASQNQLDTNTVWFITGCYSGLGKSFAQKIHEAGRHLITTARNTTTLSYLPDNEPNSLKIPLNVTFQQTITATINTAVQEFNRIDVVINNAGISFIGDTESVSEAEARNVLETNF
ncbi:hypothetical protein BBP40_005328 [Aspergillus hancockii]|nr:hypothetical protein BBP40_005328 [Aspergillus hancockii]